MAQVEPRMQAFRQHIVGSVHSIVLLLSLVVGWVVFPVVHEIEHAIEREAEAHHNHFDFEGVAFQGDCPAPEAEEDECPCCLTQLQTTVDVGVPDEYPAIADRPIRLQGVDRSGNDVRVRNPRAPPVSSVLI